MSIVVSSTVDLRKLYELVGADAYVLVSKAELCLADIAYDFVVKTSGAATWGDGNDGNAVRIAGPDGRTSELAYFHGTLEECLKAYKAAGRLQDVLVLFGVPAEDYTGDLSGAIHEALSDETEEFRRCVIASNPEKFCTPHLDMRTESIAA